MKRAQLTGLPALTEDGGVQGAAELVGAQRVEAAVLGEGRRGGHRVEQPLHARTDGLRGRAAPTAGGRPAGVGEVEQMRAFRVVEPERIRQRVQDAVGRAAEIAALHPVVVVDAEPGQRRDLFTAQSRHPTLSEDGEAGVLRGDPRAPGREEVADLGPGVHLRGG